MRASLTLYTPRFRFVREGGLMTAAWFCDFIAERNETVLGYKFGVREDRQYRTAVNEEMNSPKSTVVGSASGSAHSEATQSRHYGKLHSDPTKYLSTAELVEHREVSQRWHRVLGTDNLPFPIPRRRIFAQPQLTEERVKDLVNVVVSELLDKRLPVMLEDAFSRAAPILAEAAGAVFALKPGGDTLESFASSQDTEGSSTSTRNGRAGTVPSDPYTDGSSGGSFIDDRPIDPSPPHRSHARSSRREGKRRAVSISREDSFEDAPAAKRSRKFKGMLTSVPKLETDDDDFDFCVDNDISPIAPRHRHVHRPVIPDTSTEETSSPAPVPIPTPSLPRPPRPQQASVAHRAIVISDSEDANSAPKPVRCEMNGKEYWLTPQTIEPLMLLALKTAFNDEDASPKSAEQAEALCTVIVGQQDVCVNLPTSAGKSLTWQIVPFIFSENISVVIVTHAVLRAQHTEDALRMGIRATAFDPQHPPELEVQIVFVMLEHFKGTPFKK